MKDYVVLILIALLGLAVICGLLESSKNHKEIDRLNSLLSEDAFNPYEDCESDMDYYLQSVKLQDNKFVNVPDSVALLAAQHPHQEIAATINCAGGYLNIKLN